MAVHNIVLDDLSAADLATQFRSLCGDPVAKNIFLETQNILRIRLGGSPGVDNPFGSKDEEQGNSIIREELLKAFDRYFATRTR